MEEGNTVLAMDLSTKEIIHMEKRKEKGLFLTSLVLSHILGNSTMTFLMVKDMSLIQQEIS